MFYSSNSRVSEIKKGLRELRFQADCETWDSFSRKIKDLGVCIFLLFFLI